MNKTSWKISMIVSPIAGIMSFINYKDFFISLPWFLLCMSCACVLYLIDFIEKNKQR